MTTWRWTGSASRVLWPDGGTVSGRAGDDGRAVNDTSVVLLGEAAGVRFLLSGDAEDAIDPTLVARGLPHVALYKVAHHGSRTASSDALLAALTPAVAVISVGAGNTYGHPSPPTLARLAAHGATVLRTDLDGTVTASFEAGRMEVRGERRAGDGGLGTIAAMTVPGRVESAALLLSLDPPPWFLRHARAVAEIAGWLAARTAAAGRRRWTAPLVEAAALLHDVDKLARVTTRTIAALPHGAGSAAWLARRGHRELGPAVAAHAVTLLADARRGGTAARRPRRRPDRRVRGQARRPAARAHGGAIRVVGPALPRGPGDASAARRDERMRAGPTRSRHAVCARAGVRPEDVRRLGWTGPALAAARHARGAARRAAARPAAVRGSEPA